MKGRILISEEEKRRILQMHTSASGRMYLKEQTEPDLGFAVGNEITIKNITIPGLAETPGDLTVSVNTKTQSTRPPFKIEKVTYKPPFTPVDPKKGLYKNSEGKTITTNSVSAAAAVLLKISCGGYFSFILRITGGDSPTVSTSNFVEQTPGYDFEVGNNVINKTNGPEYVKKILGQTYDTETQNIAKSIFGSQDWVKNAQTQLPQS